MFVGRDMHLVTVATESCLCASRRNPQPNVADPSAPIVGPVVEYGFPTGVLRFNAAHDAQVTGFAESTMPVERVGGGS
jgi:hypothetical protein